MPEDTSEDQLLIVQFTSQMYWPLQGRQCYELFQEQSTAYNCYMTKEIMRLIP